MRAPTTRKTPENRNQPTTKFNWWLAAAGISILPAGIGIAALFNAISCGSAGVATSRTTEANQEVASDVDLSMAIAFDLSGSMDEKEKRSAGAFFSTLCGRVLENRAQVVLWEYAETCDLRADLYVEERGDVVEQINEFIRERKGTRGTLQTLPLNGFKQFLASGRFRSQKVLLGLYTDGESHDSKDQLDHLIRDLASDARICAVVIGPLLKENRQKYEELFAPFGNRLVLFGDSSGDRDRAAEDIERLLGGKQ
jgi:hypothetical protein